MEDGISNCNPCGERDARSANQDWLRAIAAIARINKDPTRILPGVISEHGATSPEKPALISDHEIMTFGTLTARMNRYSRWAIARGVMIGDVICLLMPNRPEYVAVWLGLSQIGAIVALLNTSLRGAGLAHSIETAGASHVIIAEELADLFAEAAPRLSVATTVWVHGSTGFDNRILDQVESMDDGALSSAERRDIKLSDRALLIYTSGTTGLPKAAYVSHYRVMAWSAWFAGVADMNEGDRMYDCLPLYHSVGGVVAIGSSLINGGSAVIAERFSVSRFWDDVVERRCTAFQYIGELCRYLLAAPPHDREKQHRLRIAVGNGLSAEIWTAFQRRFTVPRILEFYAATEANFSLTNVEGKVGAVGRIPKFLPARNTIALVHHDVEKQQPSRGPDGFCIRVTAGESGEALARISVDSSPGSRFEGYTNASDAEAKILHDVFARGDAWFRSGDLMRTDEEGFFYFVDRLGDTFRLKGENVSTTEVAAALRGCPGVADAAVYGVSIPGIEGRVGAALLVMNGTINLEEIAHQLSAALPDYARPAFLRLSPSIDVTATFKIQKHKLIEEGVDPHRIADPLYFFDRVQGSYVPLDRARHAAIAGGLIRL